ncbi:MAG TPA: TRASH domain-containing protein, partial [Spirochaetes bacterium]|nr:TRASH domain-containing protein [Spirochaetota bacterium]
TFTKIVKHIYYWCCSRCTRQIHIHR